MKYCSNACRRHKVDRVDAALEAAILTLLSQRSGGKTICPSEAARLVRPQDWEELMEPARRAARRLVSTHTIEIVQQGRVVDGSRAKGPIRLRLASSPPQPN